MMAMIFYVKYICSSVQVILEIQSFNWSGIRSYVLSITQQGDDHRNTLIFEEEINENERKYNSEKHLSWN